MQKHCLVGAAAIAATMLTSGAMAQDAERGPEGLYIRAAAGVSFVEDLDQALLGSPAQQVCLAIGCFPDQKVTSFNTGYAAAAAVGYDFGDGIRTELEYRYAWSGVERVERFEDGANSFQNPQGTDDDYGVHFVFSNFYYTLLNEATLSPYIGLGVGGAFARNENGDSDEALAYQGRVGLTWRVASKTNVDLEYNYLHTNDLSTNISDGAFETVDGDGISSSNIMLGLRMRF